MNIFQLDCFNTYYLFSLSMHIIDWGKGFRYSRKFYIFFFAGFMSIILVRLRDSSIIDSSHELSKNKIFKLKSTKHNSINLNHLNLHITQESYTTHFAVTTGPLYRAFIKYGNGLLSHGLIIFSVKSLTGRFLFSIFNLFLKKLLLPPLPSQTWRYRYFL